MNIIYLEQENIDKYTEYLTEDVAENIGRTFYHGFVVTKEDATVAGIVWEIRNILRDVDNESHIVWLRIDSEDVAQKLFETYSDNILDDGAVKSTYTLSARASEKEKNALKAAGFSVNFMEGDVIKARLEEINGLLLFHKTPSGMLEVVIMQIIGNRYKTYR